MTEKEEKDAEALGRWREEAFEKRVSMNEGVTIGIPSMSACSSFKVTRRKGRRKKSLSKLSITTR